VVTDGRSNVLAGLTLSEAEAARQSGVELYGVGVGDDVNQAELNGIASTPTSDYVVMMGSDSIDAADIVLDEICR